MAILSVTYLLQLIVTILDHRLQPCDSNIIWGPNWSHILHTLHSPPLNINFTTYTITNSIDRLRSSFMLKIVTIKYQNYTFPSFCLRQFTISLRLKINLSDILWQSLFFEWHFVQWYFVSTYWSFLLCDILWWLVIVVVVLRVTFWADGFIFWPHNSFIWHVCLNSLLKFR